MQIDIAKTWCLRRHHAFESLMALRKIGRGRVIVLVWKNDGVVCANLEHLLGSLRLSAMDGEGVLVVVYSPPIR